jgi:two-component system response regulator FixJ
MSVASNTVYVVDDDDGVRHSLRMLLEAYGYSVRDYSTASEFLKAITADDPDPGCLLLDYRLTDGNGLDVVMALRARAINLPTILMTGVLDPMLKDRAKRIGVQAMLIKPLNCDELLALIEQTQRAQSRSVH